MSQMTVFRDNCLSLCVGHSIFIDLAQFLDVSHGTQLLEEARGCSNSI